MTHDEIRKEIGALTAHIRVLCYASTKAAQQTIATLQQRRRELRAQLEAGCGFCKAIEPLEVVGENCERGG